MLDSIEQIRQLDEDNKQLRRELGTIPEKSVSTND